MKIALVIVIALAACSGGSQSLPTTTHAVTTTTSDDPIDVFHRLIAERELDAAVSEKDDAEVRSVAANLCDNDLADFRLLVSLFETIATAEVNAVDEAAEKATILDAFCPDVRVVYDQAVLEVLHLDLSTLG